MRSGDNPVNPSSACDPNLNVHSVLERISDAFFALDRELQFTYVNAEGERLLQKTRAALIGRNIWDAFPEAVGLEFYDQYQKAMKEQVTAQFQEFYPPYDKWFEVRAYPSEDGLSVFFRDVTETRRSQELMSALNTINTEINSTHDFDEIMRLVVVDAKNAIQAESAAIALRENGLWVIRYVSSFPESTLGMQLADADIPFASLAVEMRDIVAIDDAYNDVRAVRDIQERYSVRSALLIPLFIKDRVIGVFFFCHHTRQVSFSVAQIDFARKLGLATSLALENSRLYEEARRESRRSAALEVISKAGISTFNMDELLESIAESVTRVFGADCGAVMILDDETSGLRIRAEYAASPDSCLCVNVSEEMARTVFHEGRAMMIEGPQPNHWLMGSPLIIRGSVYGAVFVYTDAPHAFTSEDAGLLELMVNRSALMIDNIDLYTDLIDSRAEIQEALDREKGISRLLERALMPLDPVIDNRYRVASAYIPAFEGEGIGGDFYDVFTTEEGWTGILIGDVSGKGVEAASLAVASRSTIRAFAYDIHSPASSLRHANDVLYGHDDIGLGTFVTAFLIMLDPPTGSLLYAGAGHPPAVIRRANGTIEFAYSAQPPLGVQKPQDFDEMAERLNEGDKIVLYTDGVTEARDGSGLFGFEGIERVMQEHGHSSPDVIAWQIIDAAQKWAGGRLRDDTALIVIERMDDQSAG